MEYKRYGFRSSSLKSSASNFIEYRMLLILFGFTLGILFGNLALIAWGALFFLIGHIAEVAGKLALKIGLVFSLILLIKAVIEFFLAEQYWLSNLILALMSIALGVEGICRKRLLKT